MEFNVENLEKAITLFYSSGQQLEAHQWLNQAQNSEQAWFFVWDLLTPSKSTEVQFYAANTLHNKIAKDWHEIHVNYYDSLKKTILEKIVSYANGPKIILCRLCVVLATFVIQTLPSYWRNAFEELVSSFQPQHLPNIEPERVIWILLDILTFIPDEFQTITLSRSHKQSLKTILQGVAKDVVKYIEMCMNPLPSAGFNMSNLSTYLNASYCVYTWIGLGYLNINECMSISEVLINLTEFVYWNKLDPEGFSSEEIEVMQNNVEALSRLIELPDTYKYKTCINKFCANMLYKFQQILSVEVYSEDPNKDVITYLYSVITRLAENQSKTFIENLLSESDEKRLSLDLFKCILDCSGLPGSHFFDETASTLCFGFWHTLQDEVLSSNGGECALAFPQIKPIYRDLVFILLRKSMFPQNCTSWSADEEEVFRCYRQDIADTFMYSYHVLDLELLDIFQIELTKALAKDVIVWTEIETCLHAHSAVGEYIEQENIYLPKLMNQIKDIPFDLLDARVMSSALAAVGSYHDWIGAHPEILGSILPFIISSLDRNEFSTSATIALKDIATSCQPYIVPYADLIITRSQIAIASGMLKLSEHRRLIYIIGKVLAELPYAQAMNYLELILSPYFTEMQELVDTEPSPNVVVPLTTKLKILSSLFSSLLGTTFKDAYGGPPVLVILQNTMPLYRAIGEKYCENLSVMTELGNALKYAVNTLMDDCKPLVNDIQHLVVSIYKKFPQPHILGVSTIIILMLSKDRDVLPINQMVLVEIVNTTLNVCSQCSEDSRLLSENSDIIEEFFSMLSQLLRKRPQLIFESSIEVAPIFRCAILVLSMPETNALRACSNFLVNLITQSREVSQASVIQACGESLVEKILFILGNTAPRHATDYFSDILLALNKKYCDNLRRWLTQLLRQDDFPTNKITKAQKDNFIKSVLKEKSFKTRLSEVVLEFSLICKGILRQCDNLP